MILYHHHRRVRNDHGETCFENYSYQNNTHVTVPPATLHGISIGVSFNRTLIIVMLSGIVVAKPFLHKLQRLQNLAARVPTHSSHMMPTPMCL